MQLKSQHRHQVGKKINCTSRDIFFDNIFKEQDDYCFFTIFQKLLFSKSPFSETAQKNYDPVIPLHPKVLTSAEKKLKIGSPLKI